MTEPRDDDALSWSGDDDPTLDVGAKRPVAGDEPVTAAAELPEGYTAVGRGSEAVADEPDDEEDAPQIGNAALVALGILGGVYLLYTVGWVIGGLRLQVVAPLLNIIPAAYLPAFWLAVLAPAIWFAAAYILTRGRATWLRFVWLAAGAVLLVPWPFIMIGAVGL